MAMAAFGERPGQVITRVPAGPTSRWLAAVALGGQGRYAAATTLLYELMGQADPALASLAASTLASHRRQLGGHDAARILDAGALRRLSGLSGMAEARADALLGLAADALGMGRLAEARRLIVAVRRCDGAGWRAPIRLCWVSAEVELAAGRADLAVPHARAAAVRAEASGSTRHRIKSALVLGAALAASGERGQSRRLLDGARREAFGLGLLPLVWPCAMLLAELDPAAARAHLRGAGDALHRLLRRTDPVGRRIAACSPWVPEPVGLTG